MEENKRKQYAHLYEHHEVEDPQPPGKRKKKPHRAEWQKPPSADGGKGMQTHRLFFLAMAVVLLLALNYFQIKEAKKGSGFGIYPQRKAANEKS